MEKPSSLPKLLLFFVHFLLLSELLEARILLGDAYDCKRLLADVGYVVDEDAVLSSSHLNMADGSLDRPPTPRYTPPSPKPRPSPHPVLGCRPPQPPHGGDVLQVLQQTSPPASSSTGPAPPRDYYGRQQAESAVHPPSRLGKMMDVLRAFVDACGMQI